METAIRAGHPDCRGRRYASMKGGLCGDRDKGAEYLASELRGYPAIANPRRLVQSDSRVRSLSNVDSGSVTWEYDRANPSAG